MPFYVQRIVSKDAQRKSTQIQAVLIRINLNYNAEIEPFYLSFRRNCASEYDFPWESCEL